MFVDQLRQLCGSPIAGSNVARLFKALNIDESVLLLILLLWIVVGVLIPTTLKGVMV